jgi:conjugative transfer signal peptidase TraF
MNAAAPSINSIKAIKTVAKRRRQTLIGMMAGLALLTAATAHHLPPLLVWNGSASAPLGLYRAQFGPIQHGDLVLSQLPADVQALVGARRYLPPHIPVLKRVAALPGDVVCRIGGHVFVGGRYVAHAKTNDNMHRRMPVWSGCQKLKSGEVFLLLDRQNSFDGRYFGATSQAHLITKVAPLWTHDPSK